MATSNELFFLSASTCKKFRIDQQVTLKCVVSLLRLKMCFQDHSKTAGKIDSFFSDRFTHARLRRRFLQLALLKPGEVALGEVAAAELNVG